MDGAGCSSYNGHKLVQRGEEPQAGRTMEYLSEGEKREELRLYTENGALACY